MNRLSIRGRLTLWYAGIFAVTFALLAGALWSGLQHSIYRTVDRSLQSRLQALRYHLEQQEHEGENGNLSQEIAEDLNAVAATSLLRIASETGKWIYRSRTAEAWPAPVPPRSNLPKNGRITTVDIEGKLYRVISAPLEIGVIQIGLPLSDFHDMQALLAATVLLSSPLLLLFASIVGYWMSGIALRPINTLTNRARKINAQNLADRLVLRGTGDELDRLSETLNEMLARLDSTFARIERFTADASHELRTPVAIVRTTAEVTRAKPRTPEEQESAWDSIIAQTDRMARLIDDLLLLARADSGGNVPRNELIDAAAVLRETCLEMQVVAKSVDIELKLQAPQECTLFCDAEDLRRILLILLDNAVKYSPRAAKVFIELEITGRAEQRNAVIRVRDNGIGIPPEDLPFIFDRFYRAAKDRSRRTGGSGLGLSIARYLAERRHGSIQVESTPGAGSTFTLTLPL